MTKPEVRNPYEHMQAARRAEAQDNIRRAETQWKAAVTAADSLPLIEYKRNYREELVRYTFDPAYEARPGVGEHQFRDVYCDLLALPFSTRMYLATFYARYGAYPEAKEACDQAFMYGMDAVAKEHPVQADFYRRAEIVRQNLHEKVGPEDLPSVLSEIFDEIDTDGDGFLSDEELRAAQFDLSLPADVHRAVKYLMENYHEVEAAHRDEWMSMADIRGISRRDLQAHEEKKNSTWKRMPKR